MKTAFLIIFFLFNSHASWATKEGHGGQAIGSSKHPRLRDLSDPSVCEWKEGSSFLQNNDAKKIFKN